MLVADDELAGNQPIAGYLVAPLVADDDTATFGGHQDLSAFGAWGAE